ncbi:MAG: hypothetical protein ACXWHZ_09330 [Usitatibacter sp.]
MNGISSRFQAIAVATASPLLLAAQLALASSGTVSGAGTLAARASIDVSIEIPRVMQMRLLGHPYFLDITAEDIARGSIRVSGPSIDILANDRFGFTLRAEIVNALFPVVRITGLPSALVVTKEVATMRMPSMVGRGKPRPLAVEYELQLAADAAPGRYPWPVAITIQGP